MDVQATEKHIVAWIRKQAQDAGCKGVVVGLSGGIDSAVVGALCKKAFPDNTLGVILPCMSNPDDRKHAEMVAKKFNIPIEIVDIEPAFKAMAKALTGKEHDKEKHKGIEFANIKPRLRMTALYHFANKHNYLVAGTDNKSEAMIGYFTKYGDGGVDILPITSLFKRDVRKLAKHLGVPDEIITKHPSAGLWDGQTDEGEMGITYDELDEILHRIDTGKSLERIDHAKVEKVKMMIEKSEHKRQLPPGCILE
ncbi:NAD(+) synthase [Candidatus Woesearchaeota archaeon]|nr:NAD(+) synthase [Candidatus Woesearchaeota archaeon]